MSQPPSLPSYNALTTAIQACQVNGHAAQAHGLLCGYLCATPTKTRNEWEALFPAIQKNKQAYQLLRETITASYQQLNDFSFEFTLILPDETTDINVRAEALGLWCQGFLTALNLAHVPIQHREPGQVTEALDDILNISEISFGDIADNDEDESAYLELVEYVRLSVVMIFQELNTDDLPKEAQDDDNTLLH